MKTSLDCLPCFLRQALEVARMYTPDSAVHERIAREVLRFAGEMDFAKPPPGAAQLIQRRLRELTGLEDPYRAVKARFTRSMLELYPMLAAHVAAVADPLDLALRYALAGNVIDLGTKSGLTEEEAIRDIERAAEAPLHGDTAWFAAAARRARSILYVADNAGEIVLDRLLIAQLPRGSVTVAVRGVPVLNDATREDAEAAGLGGEAEIIENGSDAPGTILEECGEEFCERFRKADLVISKGQGNYETLSDAPEPVFCLFKVKCAVVAAHAGLPLGAHAVLRSEACP